MRTVSADAPSALLVTSRPMARKLVTIPYIICSMLACSKHVDAPNGCPPQISGMAGAGVESLEDVMFDRPASLRRGNGIQFGGDPPFLVATITKVSVECIPIQTVHTERETPQTRIVANFDIAATATISYTIEDAARYDALARQPFSKLSPTMRFEVVSGAGVVLRSATSDAGFVKGGTTTSVSTRISGLGLAEISKVSVVQASWIYE